MRGTAKVVSVRTTRDGYAIEVEDCDIPWIRILHTEDYITNVVAAHDIIPGDIIGFEAAEKSAAWNLEHVVIVLRRIKRRDGL